MKQETIITETVETEETPSTTETEKTPLTVTDNTSVTADETQTPTDGMETANTDENAQKNNSAGQLPPNAKKLKNRWWLPYLITFSVLAVITILVAWWRGCFTETDPKRLLGAWCDSFFVSGVLGAGFGLLVVASNGGTFDMLSYGFKALFRLLKRDPLDRKYGGFYEYRKSREKNKRSFWYLIILGCVFLLVGGILFIFYYKA